MTFAEWQSDLEERARLESVVARVIALNQGDLELRKALTAIENGVIVRPRPEHEHDCFVCGRHFVGCVCSAVNTENYLCGYCDSTGCDA